MFEKAKARRAEKAAEDAARRAETDDAARHHVDEFYAWSIARVRSIADGTAPSTDSSVALKANERAVYCLDGVGLVESRRGPGKWQGGTQGVSVHVPGTKSMRYRVGSTRGTYVSGEEKPTIIDQGSFTVTTTRAVFVGAKQTREWAWAKLIGFHDDDPSWIGIAVSNRQKVSGVSYPTDQAVALTMAIQAASATANGTAAQMIQGLEHQRAVHNGAPPIPPPPAWTQPA